MKIARRIKRESIYSEISDEREYQDNKWGGPNHDDAHDTRDWITYIVAYLGEAGSRETNWGRDLAAVRKLFLKVAALAVAAIESIDRKLTFKNEFYGD